MLALMVKYLLDLIWENPKVKLLLCYLDSAIHWIEPRLEKSIRNSGRVEMEDGMDDVDLSYGPLRDYPSPKILDTRS